MNSIDEWYKQWSNNSEKIIDNVNKETKQKLEKVKFMVLQNKENYFNPTYKRYAKSEKRSIVDISYIYDKIVEGVTVTQLKKKQPIIQNNDIIYEYGFNEKNECLYRKIKSKDTNQFDRLYLYLENRIYELEVSQIYNKDMSKMSMRILGEYYFDKCLNPLKINRNYGVLNNEKYDWIDENIAIINCGIKNYILMKDDRGVYAIFQKEEVNNCKKLFSYRTQNNVDLSQVHTFLEGKLSFGEINVKCSYIKDIKGKDTEYMILDIYGKKYLVSREYIRVSKEFSYQKVKEIYKTEILEFIRSQMQIIDIKVKFINIQYFDYGYSITDVMIGFDEKNCEDVHSMKVVKDVCFSDKNIKLITELDDYIKDKMYSHVVREMMKSLKKSIEQEYGIKVVLIEIND